MRHTFKLSLRAGTFLLLAIIVLASCTKKNSSEVNDKNYTNYNKLVELTSKELIELELDSVTGFSHRSTSLDQFNDQEFISFINIQQSSVYIYSVEKPDSVRVISLEREGPNGVGRLSIAAHRMISKDSLLLFNTWSGKLFLINPSGSIIKKIDLIDYKSTVKEPNPEPSTMKPIIYYDNKVIMSGSFDSYLTNYSESYTTLWYDLKTNERKIIIPLPEKYNEGYWGDQFKYNPSLGFNTLTEEILANFPIDPNIHIYDLNGNLKSTFFEKSERIGDMKPLREDINYGITKDHSVRDPEQSEYSLTNSDFQRIIHDKWRNYYYRVSFIRPTNEQYRANKKLTSISISVLNSRMEKVGEKYFSSDQYYPTSMLVSSKGIMLARIDLYNNNENALTYEVFEPVSK